MQGGIINKPSSPFCHFFNKLTSSHHQSVHGMISNQKLMGAWNVSGNFIGELFAGFPLDRGG